MGTARVEVKDIDCYRRLVLAEWRGNLRIGDPESVDQGTLAGDKVFDLDPDDAVQFFSAALALAQSVVRSRGKNA